LEGLEAALSAQEPPVLQVSPPAGSVRTLNSGLWVVFTGSVGSSGALIVSDTRQTLAGDIRHLAHAFGLLYYRGLARLVS